MRYFICFLFFVSFLPLTPVQAQSPTELYSYFQKMPEVIENDQFREAIKSQIFVPSEFYGLLNHNGISGDKLVPIGKIAAKKATILIYGVLSEEDNPDVQPLLQIATIAFFDKNGEEVVGGSKNYLCMSGEDSEVRQARIEYDGELVQFHNRLINKKGEVEEVEIAVYEIGKKALKFVEYR